MKNQFTFRFAVALLLPIFSELAWAQSTAPVAAPPAPPAATPSPGVPVSAAAAGIRDALPTTPVPGLVSQLAFMSGCWQSRTRDNGLVTEAWFTPKDGTMIGLGQTTRGGQTVGSEAMRIYQSGGTIKIWLRPDSRPELTMELDSVGTSGVGFIAKEGNDVFVRLDYDRKSDKQLLASFRRIQGQDRRGAEFAFDRIDCASVIAPVSNTAPAGKK